MFILDTNVVSELRKIRMGKADPRVGAWVASIDADRLFISAITVLELEIGVLRLERKDPTQGAKLRTWFETLVLPEFSDRTFPVNSVVALRCARLHVPDPSSERDAFIAATALVHGMTVVTRNTSDFAGTGVRIFNPWET